jgi:uncharacterized protein (DUF2062 family)
VQPLPPTSPATAPPEVATSWWRRRLVQPVLNLLKQGLTPQQLALTAVLGTAAGLIPVLGTTTLLTTAAAVRLRLNVAAALLIAHLWSPVQLLLLVPLLSQGARLWGSSGPTLTLKKVQYLFSHDLLGAWQLLWHAMVGALALWAGACCVLGPGLYFVLRLLLARAMRNRRTTAEEAAA